MPDAALLLWIRAILTDSPFHGEGHRKVWARLRMKGVRTSKRRVLRLMRAHDLLAPTRVGTPRGPRNHDGTIIPDRVDTMWGTDLTTTWTAEGQVAVFVAIDHARPSAWASMRPAGLRASRRWSRSAKGCGSASVAFRRDRLRPSVGTITVASPWRTPSRPSSRS